MQWPIYRLTFKTPLHIGQEGIGAEKLVPYVPSDTLWGALVSMHFKLGLPFDFEQLPFRLSSTFPFFKDRLFLPAPMGALDYLLTEAAQTDARQLKKVKKIQFVDQALFEKLINGEKPEFSSLHFPQKQTNVALLNKCEALDQEAIYAIYEVPRVTVDRYSNSGAEGQIFYFSQLVFNQQAGLYFLVWFRDEQARYHFEAALRLLADEGLGADRTVGRGFFSFSREQMELSVPQKADYFTTLSLYFPKQSELSKILGPSSYFRLVKRKGYAAHEGLRGFRRKMVRMFAEGSVFPKPASGDSFWGMNPLVLEKKADSRIAFDVFRYGEAFALPVKRAEDGS